MTLELAEDITATIHVWVVPVREGYAEGQVIPSAPPEDLAPQAAAEETSEEGQSETPAE